MEASFKIQWKNYYFWRKLVSSSVQWRVAKAYEKKSWPKTKTNSSKGMEKRMEEIAKELPLSKEMRPAWTVMSIRNWFYKNQFRCEY